MQTKPCIAPRTTVARKDASGRANRKRVLLPYARPASRKLACAPVLQFASAATAHEIRSASCHPIRRAWATLLKSYESKLRLSNVGRSFHVQAAALNFRDWCAVAGGLKLRRGQRDHQQSAAAPW